MNATTTWQAGNDNNFRLYAAGCLIADVREYRPFGWVIDGNPNTGTYATRGAAMRAALRQARLRRMVG